MSFTSIQDIHESVYLYLKDSGFRFIVRQRPNEKFEQGYWLLGNTSVAVTSFWEGRDWQNKTPNIYLDIYEDRIVLNFISNEDGDKQEKLSVLAAFIDMTQVIRKNGTVPHWIKTYKTSETEKNYLDLLKKFIRSDKDKIDKFLGQKEVSLLFPPINQLTFEKHIKNVEEWRAKFKKTKITPTEISDKIVNKYTLTNLKCENIGHFKSIDLNFNSRITCLIGENGSGKSTILKAVATAIATFDRNEKSPKIEDSLEYFLKLKGFVDNEKAEYEEKGLIKLNYVKDNEKKTHSNGLIFNFNDDESIKDDDECDFELNNKDNKTYKTLVLGFSQARADGVNNENGNKEGLKAPNLEDITSLINNKPLVSNRGLEDWILKLNASGNQKLLEKGKEKKTKEHEIIKKIIELVNKIIKQDETDEDILKIKNYHQIKRFISLEVDGQDVPFKIMSQGFNNVFMWIGHMIRRMSEVYPDSKDFTKEPCICLIDEIDTYLHPDWQYSILGVLCTYFEKTQFVVTTHSPYVLGSVKHEYISIYQFHKKNNKVQIEAIQENLYGASVEYLTTIMSSTRRNPNVTAKFKTLFQSLRQKDNKKATAGIAELSKLIDKDDPDLIKAQMILSQ